MYVGFDTSNYTTSVAVIDDDGGVLQQKQLLSVKHGERGLRQSEAVFQHTVNMPELISKIQNDNRIDFENVKGVGVSTRPRNIDGSYMPCFLVGINSAKAASAFAKVPLFETSHQVGHILAALYDTKHLDYIGSPFIAFHVSGGTTDALLVQPDDREIIKAELIAYSSDLKAGQAVDRTGVMLGLDFPCGANLEKLALQSSEKFKIKVSLSGMNCSLSGVENKVKQMINNGEKDCDIAAFTIEYIRKTLDMMTERILEHYGNLPIVFAGGVMSNSVIKKSLSAKYNAAFASPEFSCDNAAGVAVYAKLKNDILE